MPIHICFLRRIHGIRYPANYSKTDNVSSFELAWLRKEELQVPRYYSCEYLDTTVADSTMQQSHIRQVVIMVISH